MSVSHPYKTAPQTAFWSRAVAAGWNPAEVVGSFEPLIKQEDKVVSAGSCFASNIVPYLEKAGMTYLRTEVTHPSFQDVEPERLGYANFSAAYGNIYTARQLLQLLKRCLNTLVPAEDRWVAGDDIVDPLRPGLRYRASSHREFDLLTAQHLRKTRTAFENADVFVFTLGLTEGWVSRLDGTVYPACPGTVAGTFDPERHEFKNFSVSEITADLNEFIGLLRQINPDVRIILTVSPVPLVATATGNHVLRSTIYSKSALRVAAEEVSANHPNVSYFPAYEIVTGPQAPWAFFEDDRRSVSQAGIEAVMSALLAHCEVAGPIETPALPVAAAIEPAGASESVNAATAAQVSRLIAEAECEEAMSDARFHQAPVSATSAQNEPRKSETGEETAALKLQLKALQQLSDSERADKDAVIDDLRHRLAAERAALDEELNGMRRERDALAGEAERWFGAVIAVTDDHTRLIAPAPRRRSWWKVVASGRGGNRRRQASLVVLGDRACAAGRWEFAARYYRDALELSPSEPRIWFQFAYALQLAGRKHEAEAAFNMAFEHSGQRLFGNGNTPSAEDGDEDLHATRRAR